MKVFSKHDTSLTHERIAAVMERTGPVQGQASLKPSKGEEGIAKAKSFPSLKNYRSLMTTGGESLFSFGVVLDKLSMSQ